jgi:hypothetical protein
MTTPPDDTFPFHHRQLLLAAALALLTLVVYWQVGSHDFINYDDTVYITKNPMVAAGLTPAGVRWAFTTFHEGNWHPLTWLSHQFDVQLFGLEPRGHHLHNVLLHLANVLLLFLFLVRVTGATGRSAFVAALFAVHPLRVESVAWVAERKDVLSTLFGFLTLHCYVSYVRCRRAGWYLATLTLFTLGLMTKQMLVTLPFLLLLLDVWPLGRLQPGERQALPLLREKVPFIALALVSAYVTYVAHAAGGAVRTLDVLPFLPRLGNAFLSYVRYLATFVVPLDLAIFYPLVIPQPLWQIFSALAGLIAVSALALQQARRRPYLAVGWFWYLGMLVPVIGLVQVGAQAMADRYAYLPTIGLGIILAWGVPDLLAGWRWHQKVCAVTGTAVILVMTLLSYHQVGYWQNTRTLYEHGLRATGDNAFLLGELGDIAFREGDVARAMDLFARQRQIDPASLDYDLYRGFLAYQQGDVATAAAAFEEVLVRKGDSVKALYLLGRISEERGELNRAVELYDRAGKSAEFDDSGYRERARQDLVRLRGGPAAVPAGDRL